MTTAPQGAEGLNLLNTTYGDPSIGHSSPNLIYKRISWTALGSATPPTNIYQLNLLVQTQSGQFKAAQSIGIDNERCLSPVQVTVAETNYNFIVPAFTRGIYPLVCGNAPNITVQTLGQSLSGEAGWTDIFVFNRSHPPFEKSLYPQLQLVGQMGAVGQFEGSGIIHLPPSTAGSSVFTFAKNDVLGTTLVLKALTIQTIENWSVAGSYLATFSIQETGPYHGLASNPTFTKTLFNFLYTSNSSRAALGAWSVMQLIPLVFDPPLICVTSPVNNIYPALQLTFNAGTPAAMEAYVSVVGSLGNVIAPWTVQTS